MFRQSLFLWQGAFQVTADGQTPMMQFFFYLGSTSYRWHTVRSVPWPPQLPVDRPGLHGLLSLWAWSSCGHFSWSRSLPHSRPRRSRPGTCCGRRLHCTKPRLGWLDRRRCTTSLLYGNEHSYLWWEEKEEGWLDRWGRGFFTEGGIQKTHLMSSVEYNNENFLCNSMFY